MHIQKEFFQAWAAVTAFSKRYTHSSYLLVERYLHTVRHVEIQVASDSYRTVHFFERDCTVQRRNQKIIEETPAIFVAINVLEKMYMAAVHLISTLGYVGIATVEFLVDEHDNFYFLEINPRLQVEHAVTEMVTGIDLVALQLQLAQGKRLLLNQSDIVRHGYALQCRLYAEDVRDNFAPSPGAIQVLNIPYEPFVRIEHDLHNGIEISPLFDPMIAKVVAYGLSREQVILRMRSVLQQLYIYGIQTNNYFLQKILLDKNFCTGNYHTTWYSKQAVVDVLCGERKAADQQHELALIASLLAEYTDQQPDVNSIKTPVVNTWKHRGWR